MFPRRGECSGGPRLAPCCSPGSLECWEAAELSLHTGTGEKILEGQARAFLGAADPKWGKWE